MTIRLYPFIKKTVMKYLQFALFITLCTATLFSCKDENSVEPAPYLSIDAGTVQGTVNGQVFNSTSVSTSNFEVDLIRINASAVTEGISLVTTGRTEGVYQLGVNQQNFLEYSEVDAEGAGFELSVFTTLAQGGATGTIEILDTDFENQTVSGIFSGTLIRDTDPSSSLVIENGLFNQIPY